MIEPVDHEYTRRLQNHRCQKVCWQLKITAIDGNVGLPGQMAERENVSDVVVFWKPRLDATVSDQDLPALLQVLFELLISPQEREI